jgi:CubicO group peptidase (beta-lactamase class C family)
MNHLSRIANWITAGILTLCLAATGRTNAVDEKTQTAVNAIFEDLTKPGSPGCALGVYRDGKTIYSKGYGLANLETNTPITPSSIFDIASTSKQFTAASILLLEKQKKISISDDVRKYVPELPDYGKKITILHLLNHTSGLRDYLLLMILAGVNTDSVATDDETLALVTRQKTLNFEPGSKSLYCNTGYFLMSVIVKRVSGKTLREFAAGNIFAPLKMSHTQYRNDHNSVIPNRTMAYSIKKDGGGYSLDVSYFEQTGDGAVYTSVEDLQKWDENFYSAQIGGEDVIAALQGKGKLNNGKSINYAKGLVMEEYRGLPTVRHSGSWGGYRAELLRFPKQHFSVACLCNLGSSDPAKRVYDVADLYLSALLKPKAEKKINEREKGKENKSVNLTLEQLSSYIGDYYCEELGVVYRFGIAASQLKLVAILDAAGFPRPSRLSAHEVRATSPDEFEISDMFQKFQFKRTEKNKVSEFVLDFEPANRLRFVRTNAIKGP